MPPIPALKSDENERAKLEVQLSDLDDVAISMPSTTGYGSGSGPAGSSGGRSQPQVFTDEELSEIFQIDFASIFGSPDENLKSSSYKGVQLPTSQKMGSQKGHCSDKCDYDRLTCVCEIVFTPIF